MAKQKIIKSVDLKSLELDLICDIDAARIEAKVYLEEEQRQRQTKQDTIIIEQASKSVKFWNLRADTLHECLVKIKQRTSEIEI